MPEDSGDVQINRGGKEKYRNRKNSQRGDRVRGKKRGGSGDPNIPSKMTAWS